MKKKRSEPRDKKRAGLGKLLGLLMAAFVAMASFIQFGLKKDLYGFTYYYAHGFVSSFGKRERNLIEKTDLPVVSQATEEIASNSRVTVSHAMWLVNAGYPISEEAVSSVELFESENGWLVSSTAYEKLAELFAACREETGSDPIVTSAYRTFEEQEALYASTPDVAVEAGTSEHQCGLAVDIKTEGYASRRFILRVCGMWWEKNAARFGFIIRYPYWGRKTTMVTYEPRHLRYVGVPHAEIITRSHITLEEYY
ncbi:MAG: M15 family metallopeptidase, partial [Ruminococcus sp.]|nr:M15 family metallopeptidase [Candidatus Apopatosoma intestinale]